MKGLIECVLDDCCGEVAIAPATPTTTCNECAAIYQRVSKDSFRVTPPARVVCIPLSLYLEERDTPDAHEDANDQHAKTGEAFRNDRETPPEFKTDWGVWRNRRYKKD